MPALCCASSTHFEDLKNQLSAVELQLLQLQKLSPAKTDLEALEASLDEKIQGLVKAQADLGVDLQALVTKIENLESKLEDTNFRLAQLAQQIAATNQELQEVRNVAKLAQTRTPPPPQLSPDLADPQTLYDTAYADYGRGSYDLAILGFRQYLETFPDTELADNATYWIGECYYRQSKFQEAISQFDEVLTRYERSDRVPSALLKKGYAYLELGQRAQGVVQLQSVICEYAGTDEARLARQRLQELGIDVEC